MPFRYTISQEQHSISVDADGKIDLPSIVQEMKNVAADQHFHSEFHVIIDLRNMDYEPSIHDIFNIRDALVMLKSKYKGPISLVTERNMLYAANLFCVMAKAYNIAVTASTEMEVMDDVELNK